LLKNTKRTGYNLNSSCLKRSLDIRRSKNEEESHTRNSQPTPRIIGKGDFRKRRCSTFAEKSSNGVYLQNAHAFSIIGGAFATIFEVGVWETFEFVVTVTSHYFWTWSVPFIVLGAVFFWRRYSFKKEFNALVERAKEEITLGKKKPLETNRTLVKGLEGFLKSLQTEYQFEQRKR